MMPHITAAKETKFRGNIEENSVLKITNQL